MLCAGQHQVVAVSGQINHPLLDPFSLVHFGVGLGLGIFGFGLLPSIGIAVLWEVAEHLLKNCLPHAFVFPSQDTLVNAVGDVLATVVGWRVVQPLSPERQRREQRRQVQQRGEEQRLRPGSLVGGAEARDPASQES